MKLAQWFFHLENRLAKLDNWVLLISGGLILLVIGSLDFLSGTDLSVSFFYLVPVGLIAWFTGRRWAIFTALAAALVSLVADIAGRRFEPAYIPLAVWNNLMRLGFFLVVAVLAIALHAALDQEKSLANTDFVTGVANARAFRGLAEHEIALARRAQLPLSLAYLDIDDFKQVNDQFGHSAGDEVLRRIALEMKRYLRSTDMIARIGGDEFVVLLKHTELEANSSICERLQAFLGQAILFNQWPVSFSIGLITYEVPPDTIDEMIHAADELMYAVKRQGKNSLLCQIIPARQKIAES